jgi:hypothetical protein
MDDRSSPTRAAIRRSSRHAQVGDRGRATGAQPGERISPRADGRPAGEHSAAADRTARAAPEWRSAHCAHGRCSLRAHYRPRCARLALGTLRLPRTVSEVAGGHTSRRGRHSAHLASRSLGGDAGVTAPRTGRRSHALLRIFMTNCSASTSLDERHIFYDEFLIRSSVPRLLCLVLASSRGRMMSTEFMTTAPRRRRPSIETVSLRRRWPLTKPADRGRCFRQDGNAREVARDGVVA